MVARITAVKKNRKKPKQQRGTVFHDSLVKKDLHHRGQNCKYKVVEFGLWRILRKTQR